MSGPPPWRAPLDSALRAGGGQPSSRFVQLATVRLDGRPANRTVVFRGFVEPAGLLLITTDTRSAKAAQLARCPAVELCWWFPETREQFRLLGTALPADDGRRTALWLNLPEATRQTFTWPEPGAPRAVAEAFTQPAPDAPPPGFGLLAVSVDQVDHLDLRPRPHDRTVYRLDATGWEVERVNP